MDKIVKVTIEKGPDLFSAWADDIPGIYGEGESVKDVKDDILRAVELYKAIKYASSYSFPAHNKIKSRPKTTNPERIKAITMNWIRPVRMKRDEISSRLSS